MIDRRRKLGVGWGGGTCVACSAVFQEFPVLLLRIDSMLFYRKVVCMSHAPAFTEEKKGLSSLQVSCRPCPVVIRELKLKIPWMKTCKHGIHVVCIIIV